MSQSDNKAGCGCSCNAAGHDPSDPQGKKGGFLAPIFQKASSYLRDAGIGAVASHGLTCVLLPTVLGASISGALMTGAMLVASPVMAVGVSYGIQRLKGHRPSLKGLAGSAALAFAIAAAYVGLRGHDHDHDHKDAMRHRAPMECLPPPRANDTVLPPATAAWFQRLEPSRQDDIRGNARATGMTLPQYLKNVCYTPAP